jgi:antitoxin (DNA-binding transcriptional repressor) of toxin-antitoxin stability system
VLDAVEISDEKDLAMSVTMTVDEAQAKLKDLIRQLAPGEEVVLTENEQPVAKLISQQPKPAKLPRPGPGLCKGIITYMAPDFDAPLEDMKDYME